MKKLLYLLMFVLAPLALNAQQTVEITASAVVYAPLNLTVLQQLDFGGLIAGQSKAVAPADASSAVVSISGPTSVNIDIGFTLPSNLTGTGGSLPISFSATDAGYNSTNDKQGLTAFDPSGAQTVALSGTGDLFLYLGGTVTAGGTQTAGSYTGTVTVGVSYN